MPTKPKNPPTTPPIIGAICIEVAGSLLLFECCTVGNETADCVAVVVIVCTTTDPLACVEVDSLVKTIGVGVDDEVEVVEVEVVVVVEG